MGPCPLAHCVLMPQIHALEYGKAREDLVLASQRRLHSQQRLQGHRLGESA